MSERKENIGKALGRVVSGIAILTAQEGVEKEAILASWFQQVSFEPPMLSVAVKKDRPIQKVIDETKKFALNILCNDQKEVLAHFGKGFKPGINPFEGIEVEEHSLGLPLLKESHVYLVLEVKNKVSAGDHDLYLVEAVDGDLKEKGEPMVHVRRSGFHY
ncbi:MAG: flavin reductase family protein [Deltaproteobacteria bacterium]|nr:flavin reductase family protein [Deltaproteobacteria bacterium]